MNTETPAAPASAMSAFYTAEKAENGIKLFLQDLNGKQTEHWLKIRGMDAEEFRVSEMVAKREAQKLAAIADDRERDLAIIDLSRRTAATLVMAWSFPEPCTQTNVIAFFKKAPQIEKQVDLASGSRKLFSKLGSDSSTNTSEPSIG